jgi:hypothetical protein
MIAKMFNVDFGDVVSITIAVLVVAFIVGSFSWSIAVGAIIGNRIFSVLAR